VAGWGLRFADVLKTVEIGSEYFRQLGFGPLLPPYRVAIDVYTKAALSRRAEAAEQLEKAILTP